MTPDEQAQILFTVESHNPFIFHPHNARFRTTETVEASIDDYPNSRFTTPAEDESSTPAPEKQIKTYLRFAIDNIGDQSIFVFGTNPEDCDVYIRPAQRTSKRLFSIELMNNGKIIMLKNRTRHGINIESHSYKLQQIKSQRALVQGDKLTVSHAGISVDIHHLKHKDAALHEIYLRQLAPRLAQAVPDVNLLALSSVAESSARSRGTKRYELYNEIGRGAFGAVYKAVQVHTGALVAIKEFRTSSSKNRPLLEAAILESLSHDNIVKFIEFISPESGPKQLVMELVEHDNLEHAHNDRHLDMGHIRDLMGELLSGLQYLHSRQVTHRDLKPSNILLVSYEPMLIKLTDFGLSVARTDELTSFLGTVLYLAPEVHKKVRKYTNKVDMWSVGVIVLWLALDLPEYPAGRQKDWPGLLHDRLEQASSDSLFYYFTKSLLQTHPERRPSAQESLRDRFLLLESHFHDAIAETPTEYASFPSEHGSLTTVSGSHPEDSRYRSQNAPSPPETAEFEQTQIFAPLHDNPHPQTQVQMQSQVLAPPRSLPEESVLSVVAHPKKNPITYWKLKHSGVVVMYRPGDESINITQLASALGHRQQFRWRLWEETIGNLDRISVRGQQTTGTYVSMANAERVLRYLELSTNLLQVLARLITDLEAREQHD